MIAAILFFIILMVYAIFSYSLVDPNLVLSTNEVYWNFQQWMWSNFFHNGKLMAYIYLSIVISLFILYFHLLEKAQKNKIILKNVFKNKYILIFLVLVSPLFISYNALSHDVFNYIFYARMIVKYGVDSKTHIALDFPNDLWIRFMHNIHVIDVYGRGWTFGTLIPYLFGLGKFTLTLAMFRIWTFLGMILLYLSMQFFSKVIFLRKLNVYEASLVFLNPLLLIETLSNYHNDLFMMPFAIFALGLLIKPITHKITDNKIKIKYYLASLILLAISISIKYATLALLPIWFLILGVDIFSFRFSQNLLKKYKLKIPREFIDKILHLLTSKLIIYIPDLAALIMMFLLCTPRSKYFLPWYLAWVIVWIPFMKIKTFRNLIIVFTFSSSLRYLPWIFNNLEYSQEVLRNEIIITWAIPAIYLFTNLRKKFSLKKINVK